MSKVTKGLNGAPGSATETTDLWGFVCPRTSGCGRDGVPFKSMGWPTKKLAEERLRQHLNEHDTGEVAQELNAFRAERGLVPTPDGPSVRTGVGRVGELAEED